MSEPVSEAKMIGQTYDMDTFSKYGHLLGPEYQNLSKIATVLSSLRILINSGGLD